MRYALAAVLLMCSPALAGKAEWNPPARFDHAYSGKLSIVRLPPKLVRKHCDNVLAKLGLGRATPTQKGCAVQDKGSCKIWVIDRPMWGTTTRAVIRHEMGHCNGWPGDHSK